MRKLTLLMVVLFLFASVFTVTAQEEETSPLTVSGTLDFALTDSTSSDVTLPTYATTKSATATLNVATQDEKVSASMTMNLNPSVTTTLTPGSKSYLYDDEAYLDSDVDDSSTESELYSGVNLYGGQGYRAYWNISNVVNFWNAHSEDETAVKEKLIWDADAADFIAIHYLATPDKSFDLVDEWDRDDDTITLKTPVAPGETAASDEFVLDDTVYTDLRTIAAEGIEKIAGEVDSAIDRIMLERSSNIGAWGGSSILADVQPEGVTLKLNVTEHIQSLDTHEIDKLTSDDKALLKQALDLERGFAKAVGYLGTKESSSVTSELSDFITAASLTVKKIGGVADMTMNFGGQHASAGAINVDGSGHSSDAVKAYPSVNVALSSGVVENLRAGVTLFIDDNGVVANHVSDDFYTWLDEKEQTVEAKYAADVSAGYTYPISEDMKMGADVTYATYDILAADDDDTTWAVSVVPSFSGMGANVDMQFDYADDETMYYMASAGYTVSGITPSLNFHYVKNGEDYVLSYASTAYSVMQEVKNDGGMVLGGDISAKLDDYVGMPLTLSGGYKANLEQAGDSNAWNVGLNVVPMSGLTLDFGINSDSVRFADAGSDVKEYNYSGKVSYKYGAATLYGSYGSAYNTTDEENYGTYTIGTTVSF